MFKSKKRSEAEDKNSYAVEVNNVSKRFRIPHEKRTTVYDNVLGIVTGKSYSYEVFEALKGVSFKIKKGEAFGIIGQNGSGKSTLLKILAGVLSPDSGSVKITGKIAPFLELGVGFQPELTAIENVYLYGAIMGLKKSEMDSKIDSIFEFAELERFRNAKLKNFSSGMYARLAFSTAISTDPDVLLVDEVLSVGDESFQTRCSEKINEFKKCGKTIVFVSHALGSVKEICNKCLLIQNGKIVSSGDTEDVVSDYLNMVNKKEVERITAQYKKMKENLEKNEIDEATNWGTKEAKITEIKFHNSQKESYIFQTGQQFIAKIKYRTNQKIEKPVFGVAIYKDDIHVTGPNTKFCKMQIEYIEGEGEVDFIIDNLPLLDGDYKFSAAIYDESCQKPYDHQHRVHEFKVKNAEIRNYGLFNIPGRWVLK